MVSTGRPTLNVPVDARGTCGATPLQTAANARRQPSVRLARRHPSAPDEPGNSADGQPGSSVPFCSPSGLPARTSRRSAPTPMSAVVPAPTGSAPRHTSHGRPHPHTGRNRQSPTPSSSCQKYRGGARGGNAPSPRSDWHRQSEPSATARDDGTRAHLRLTLPRTQSATGQTGRNTSHRATCHTSFPRDNPHARRHGTSRN